MINGVNCIDNSRHFFYTHITILKIYNPSIDINPIYRKKKNKEEVHHWTG